MKKIVFILLVFMACIATTTQAQISLKLLADINATPDDSELKSGVVWNGKYYFASGSKYAPKRIMVYNGNTPPTLAPGITTASTQAGVNPTSMVVYNNNIFFSSYVSGRGYELMKYDGRSAPTLVADIWRGLESSNPRYLTVSNRKLYFSAKDKNGYGLWSYDGSYISRRANVTIGDRNGRNGNMVNFKDRLYFTGHNGDGDIELYEYFGTGSPYKHDINSKTSGTYKYSSNPSYLVGSSNALYFAATGTDGISDIYKLVQRSYAGIVTLAHTHSGTHRNIKPSHLALFKNKLYFQGIPQVGKRELLEFDGANDFKVVHQIAPGFHVSPMNLTVTKFNNNDQYLYFSATTPNHGYELYQYDGIDTPKLVVDMIKGKDASNPSNLVSFKNRLLYTAKDTITGMELRQYTGVSTNAPTLVIDLSPKTQDANPQNFTEFNGKMYFQATTPKYGAELWEYDGTNAPKMVSDFRVGSYGSKPRKGIVYNNKLYYSAHVGFGNKNGLIEYDGVNPPKEVTNLNLYNNIGFAIYKGNLYFQANTATEGVKLWMYNGDTASIVSALGTGVEGSSPKNLYVYNNKLYFSALGAKGNELWMYDGVNVPSLFADINVGSASSNPAHFVEFKDTLYFAAQGNRSNQGVLWKIDGNNTPVKVGNNNLYSIWDVNVFNGVFYLSGSVGQVMNLFTFDGLRTFRLVEDIRPGKGANPWDLTNYHGKMYFSANDGDRSRELWSYDGTDTAQITKLPGEVGINPSFLFVFDKKLYFSADVGITGREIWEYTTPVTGTGIVKNIVHSATIYPNPTSNIITVNLLNLPIQKITVLTTGGVKVSEYTDTASIDVSALASGVYVLLIETTDNVGYSKLIKQ